MPQTTLDDITHREIILSLILLKPGPRNFRVEDLKRGLGVASNENPRLKIPSDSVDTTFFFYDHYLHGDFDLPHYRLNEYGKKCLQKDFDGYAPELQNTLRELAGKVWQNR